jgi:hypothetical protein
MKITEWKRIHGEGIKTLCPELTVQSLGMEPKFLRGLGSQPESDPHIGIRTYRGFNT